MKKLILTVLIWVMMLPFAYAQGVGVDSEVKEMVVSPDGKSILVKTEYRFNDKVVDVDGTVCIFDGEKYVNGPADCMGIASYRNTFGADEAITAQMLKELDIHASNLITMIPENRTFINEERMKRIDELKIRTPQSIIDNIKDQVVGQKRIKTEVIHKFKSKDIKVTYDKKNTVSNSLSP